MARQVTTRCDFCGKEVEQIACKLYLAPVLPGKASTSFMAGYSHYGDVCESCMAEEFIPKMTRRQARNGTSASAKPKTKTKRRTRH